MNPILVEVYRNEVLESFHRGVVCVVDSRNQVIFSRGDIHQLCYPRSAMKLLQVIPLLEAGGMEHFDFTLEEIAIMCGSHNGEPEHIRVVRSVLGKCGLDESALQCGSQYPTAKKEADQLIRDSIKPGAIHNNCSGKHAGMLAMCILKHWPVENYLHPGHPLQQAILETCSLFYEWPKEKMVVALDGCSAPIFSVPVINQAIGYKNLINPVAYTEAVERSCAIIIEAVSGYPFMVAGTNRYCTEMLQVTAPTIIGKTGAEGIFCMGFTEHKLGVCIKIDDGKMQPQYNVAQALIEATKIFSMERLKVLHSYNQSEIRNFNKFITGEIRAAAGLFDDFNLIQ
ncbi:MAG: asparaginase [Bacteroidia bacterium]|jgi:L-asparaginase II